MADNVVMADRVVARRPMHMPEGTYDPKAVVVIDRGDPTKPLEKLALGELMPRTEGSAVLAALGTTREDNGEFSVDSITVLTGDCIHTELGKVYLDKGYYHVSATFVVWMDRDMPPVDGIIVPHIGAAIGSGNTYLTEVGASFDLSNSSSTDTLSISFDTDISSDGTELRLVLGGMPAVSADEAGLAKVTLEQLSVHKITAVTSGGSGGGSGDSNLFIGNPDTTFAEWQQAYSDGKALMFSYTITRDGTPLYTINPTKSKVTVNPGKVTIVITDVLNADTGLDMYIEWELTHDIFSDADVLTFTYFGTLVNGKAQMMVIDPSLGYSAGAGSPTILYVAAVPGVDIIDILTDNVDPSQYTETQMTEMVAGGWLKMRMEFPWTLLLWTSSGTIVCSPVDTDSTEDIDRGTPALCVGYDVPDSGSHGWILYRKITPYFETVNDELRVSFLADPIYMQFEPEEIL